MTASPTFSMELRDGLHQAISDHGASLGGDDSARRNEAVTAIVDAVMEAFGGEEASRRHAMVEQLARQHWPELCSLCSENFNLPAALRRAIEIGLIAGETTAREQQAKAPLPIFATRLASAPG